MPPPPQWLHFIPFHRSSPSLFSRYTVYCYLRGRGGERECGEARISFIGSFNDAQCITSKRLFAFSSLCGALSGTEQPLSWEIDRKRIRADEEDGRERERERERKDERKIDRVKVVYMRYKKTESERGERKERRSVTRNSKIVTRKRTVITMAFLLLCFSLATRRTPSCG